MSILISQISLVSRERAKSWDLCIRFSKASTTELLLLCAELRPTALEPEKNPFHGSFRQTIGSLPSVLHNEQVCAFHLCPSCVLFPDTSIIHSCMLHRQNILGSWKSSVSMLMELMGRQERHTRTRTASLRVPLPWGRNSPKMSKARSIPSWPCVHMADADMAMPRVQS